MGFTSLAGAGSGQENTTQSTPAITTQSSFSGRLGDYFKNQYPVAGGIAGAMFDPRQPQSGAAPLMPLPGNVTSQPDYSVLAMQNNQPQRSSGLATVLKLIGL